MTGRIEATGPDLVVRGGTIVTARGSRRADLAVSSGEIVAIEPELGGATASAEVLDATGLLVLPGAVDVHTHTRVATDSQPDRFFIDSVAAALGGTTTFLAFNNPGTGSSAAAERSLLVGLTEWRSATEADSAIDVGLSLAISGRMERLLEELPAIVDGGVSTAKAFMVFDFRLDDARIEAAMRVLGGRGGMLQVHCEEAALIDPAVMAALQRGDTSPRHHVTTRGPEVEAIATRRVMTWAQASGAPVHVVHLSSAGALAAVRAAKSAGARVSAETCPHYLALTETCYDEPDPVRCASYLISPPLRSADHQAALWDGLADGGLDIVASDHVPDRLDTEKAEAASGTPFDRISNGAPGIETLGRVTWSEGLRRGLSLDRLVEVLATAPARRFGLERKGELAVGRDADLVLLDPTAGDTIRAAELHHTSDYTPYEGLPVTGRIRRVVLRGRTIVADGRYLGVRGDGRYVARTRAAAD
jgi:dihydropyrimidinase